MFDWQQRPHRRLNPLTGEWLLVSPHRATRPWQGQEEPQQAPDLRPYDPNCYLCPGNRRAGGVRNPRYRATFVFDNDFAALEPATPPGRFNRGGLLRAEAEPGVCRVVCFSPNHQLTLARMARASVRKVVDAWAQQYAELGANPAIRYVLIFENRGAMMGCSNPHPHGQIWASHRLPNEPAKEQAAQAAWRARRGACLLCEYSSREAQARVRMVEQNAGFRAMVPFWAVWPFEILLVSRRHYSGIDRLPPAARDQLADILKRVTARYDRLFGVPFPYTMGFHQRPTDGREHPEWHLHAHFYPPLLRSATVRKFMVGYEMLAEPQRDLTPEEAAKKLRQA
jgi:UDPglucose--hexose-1-phosphate uridylyltransferase